MSRILPSRVQSCLLVCFAVSSVAISVVAANQGAGDSVDISFPLVAGRPMLITMTSKMEGAFRAGAESFPMLVESETKIVDEILESSAEKARATRAYVQAFAKSNGDIDDPPYNGLKLEYSRDDKEVKVELTGERILPAGFLNRLLADYDSVGCWFELPKKSQVGKPVKLDINRVAPLLGVTGSVAESSEGSFILKEFDIANYKPVLAGDVTIAQAVQVAGYPGQLTLSGKCTIEANVLEQRFVSMNFAGKWQLTTGSEVGVRGDGKFTLGLTTNIDKSATKVRSQAPKYRSNIYRARGLGVGIKLPSYYAPLETAYPSQAWVRGLRGDKGVATITLEAIEGDPSNPNFTYDKFEGYLKKEYPGLETQKVQCGLGAGRIFFIPKSEEGEEELMQAEIYPFRKGFVMFRLYGPPKAYRASREEFQKARSTIGVLE
ncbi:MAG: hypothetical protein ACKVX7_15490 [Planctomycetota bacterium]